LFEFDVLKYFEISLTFLGDIAGTGGGSLLTLAGLSVLLLPFSVLMGFTFGVNSVETFCLKELLLPSV